MVLRYMKHKARRIAFLVTSDTCFVLCLLTITVWAFSYILGYSVTKMRWTTENSKIQVDFTRVTLGLGTFAFSTWQVHGRASPSAHNASRPAEYHEQYDSHPRDLAPLHLKRSLVACLLPSHHRVTEGTLDGGNVVTSLFVPFWFFLVLFSIPPTMRIIR